MKVKYLSWIRNRVGVQEEVLSIPGDLKTVSDFMTWISSGDEKHRFLGEHKGIINVSVNGKLVQDWSIAPLSDDDEVVLFSPIAGG